MKSEKRPLLVRLLVGIGVPAVIAAVCLLLMSGKLSLMCVFYETTGLYCPGCGSGRALSALLRGNLAESFMHNMLCYILGIPASFVFVWEYVRFVFPGAGLKPLRISDGCARVCLALVIIFTVLRNIPFFSFLAP